MDRPSRSKKTVNYSDFQDDDDEDFACAKPPPKKARTATKEADSEENKITSSSPNDTVALVGSGNKSRVSLDDKRYESDLEAALTLSLLETSKTHNGEPPIKTDECSADDHDRLPQCSPPVLIHCSNDDIHSAGDGQPRPDSPPVLSNCSIDGRSLGLNLINVDASPPKVSKQTKASEKQTKSLKEKNKKEDDDYKPQNTPDSESDADLTEEDESEDETFTVKKKKAMKQKPEKKAAPAAKDKKEKKEKKPSKESKAKTSAPSPSVCQSPVAPVSGRKKTPTTPPVSKPVLCSSPAGGRLPKWTPPGLVGRSQNQNTPVKSPGQGLRLGLSRRARVKPLHPNVAAN